MRAAQFTDYGDPDVLRVIEIDEPHAGAGEIRVAVRSAGVNGMDWKIRSGQLREKMPLSLPAGSGLDAAGIVEEIGDGVDAGQTVLISGASGGVGSAAVQFARARGAIVIGTAGPAHQRYVEQLGATPTTYGAGLVERVRSLAPNGIDAAFDIAGSGVIPELVELTGDPRKVVSIADFTAGEHGAQVSSGGSDRRAALSEAARLFDAGRLRIPVANTFTLDQAAAAHAASETGHVAGRTVIVID